MSPQLYLLLGTVVALGLLIFFLMRTADKQLSNVKSKSKKK